MNKNDIKYIRTNDQYFDIVQIVKSKVNKILQQQRNSFQVRLNQPFYFFFTHRTVLVGRGTRRAADEMPTGDKS